MLNNYDLFIPCGKKDYVKIKYCIEHAVQYLDPKPTNIFISSPDRIKMQGVTWINEVEAVGFGYDAIAYRRAPWVYQQLLKLCQNVTQDLYLTIDADTMLVKPFKVFSESGRTYRWVNNHEQHHQPYFNFMKKIWNLDKVADHTFISELMLFDRKICRELIPDARKFIHNMNNIITDDCIPSEFEIYGNYFATKHPSDYEVKNIKTEMHGKYMPDTFSFNEIKDILSHKTNADVVSLHSWS